MVGCSNPGGPRRNVARVGGEVGRLKRGTAWRVISDAERRMRASTGFAGGECRVYVRLCWSQMICPRFHGGQCVIGDRSFPARLPSRPWTPNRHAFLHDGLQFFAAHHHGDARVRLLCDSSWYLSIGLRLERLPCLPQHKLGTIS